MKQELLKQTMSSLQIAEVVNMTHKNVIRAIRKMEETWYKVCGRNFALASRMVEMPNGGYRSTDVMTFRHKIQKKLNHVGTILNSII